MKMPPYSLSDAKELCKEYKYLIGEPYGFDHPRHLVSDVVVTPFDEAGKSQFLLYYHLVPDAESILTEIYNGLLFDVLVIGRSQKDANDINQKNLSQWIHASNPASRNNAVAAGIRATLNGSAPATTKSN
jgi:hypothetical protein